MDGTASKPFATAGLAACWAAFVALFVVYTANGRAIGAGDVVPATLLPVAILRGDGLVLDRFEGLLRTPAGAIPGYAEESRGHIVPRYPVGPSLVALPFVLPQLLWVDLTRRGWERDPNPDHPRLIMQRMAKNAAAAIAALGAVATAVWLRRLGLRPAAVVLGALVAMGLGSDHWAVASQALWQHGPAVLCLAASLLLLAPPGPSRGRLFLAGVLAGLMVACRPIDAVIVAAVWVAVVLDHGRPGRWAFTLGGALVAAGLLAYNLYFFDVPMGGYAAIERMHPWAHGTHGTWTSPWREGAPGTLISPSHGLFVYSPWVLLALVVLPVSWRRPGGGLADAHPHDRRLAAALLLALVPTFGLLARYSCWWAGHCYGPRFWIDSGPSLALALALAVDRARDARPPLQLAFGALLAAALAVAIALQAIAAACYPSSWHGHPTSADRDHARLWDWSDTEFTRCLREGPHPRRW